MATSYVACSSFDSSIRNAIEGLLCGNHQTVGGAAIAHSVARSKLQMCVTSYITELKRLGMFSKAGYLARVLAEDASLHGIKDRKPLTTGSIRQEQARLMSAIYFKT
ncbi:hypothetical protein HI914_07436 [Erysiphe necator]|nr:hypothetical protein HI914_07436 [Erysiphe necator]